MLPLHVWIYPQCTVHVYMYVILPRPSTYLTPYHTVLFKDTGHRSTAPAFGKSSVHVHCEASRRTLATCARGPRGCLQRSIRSRGTDAYDHLVSRELPPSSPRSTGKLVSTSPVSNLMPCRFRIKPQSSAKRPFACAACPECLRPPGHFFAGRIPIGHTRLVV